MAVTYGFYNALNHDRLYDAIQMSSIFDGIIRDGIFSTIGDTMIVTAPEDGLYVNVGSGRAWFNHTWTLNDTDYPIEAEQAEVVLDRIDAVILEVNSSAAVRANSIKFLKGTPSSNPVKPTLTHNAEVNQYALAYVRIRAGQTTIFQSDIENAVGTDETPFITGVLQQVSIETLLQQWETEFNTYFTNFQNTSTTEFNNWFAAKVSEYTAWFAQMQTDMDSNFNEFDAWFQRMKDQLDENQAGHLQLQIDNLSGRIDDLDAEMPFAGGSKVNINFEYDVKPNIQYSNGHYKLTVGDTVRENNFSSSELHFDEYGILTVGDGILEVTYDVTDSITGKITHLSYTYTINMPYFGRFAYNVTIFASLYNYQGWLESINKDPSQYSTIEDVFADEKLLRELMTRHASVDYLVEWLADNNEDAHTVLNNDYCAKWINLRDYALDKLYANPTVKAVMDEVDKYGYGEWTLVNQIPTMTSNTTPSGKASCGSNGTDAYCAFDNSLTTKAILLLDTQTDGASYVQYEFDEPTKIVRADIRLYYSDKYTFISGCKYTLKASNNQTDWDVLYEWTQTNKSDVIINFPVSTNVAYKYYRLDASKGNYKTSQGSFFNYVFEISLLNWQPKGAVPVMTSNTAPYGEAFASNSAGDRYQIYNAFDDNTSTEWSTSVSTNQYIGYKFVNPICVRKIRVITKEAKVFTVQLQGSNDNSTWENIGNSLQTPVEFSNVLNNSYFLYYRINCTDSSGSTFNTLEINFYGRQLNVSVPVMTSDTTPYGEVFADEYIDHYTAPYKAFDNDNLSWWTSSNLKQNSYVGYDFKKPVLIKKVCLKQNQNAGNTVRVEYSDDKNVWTSADCIFNTIAETIVFSDVNEKKPHRYWRFFFAVNNNCTSTIMANFYGVDYTEREFEEGSTMKYIYDHGVKLEPLVGFKNQNGDLVDTDSYEYLYMEKKVSAAGNVAVRTVSKIDLTNYALMRAKVGNIFVGGNNAIFVISLQTPTTADAAIAASGFNANNLPDNNALDLSNINQSLYCDVGLVESDTVTRKQSITEWWLE